MIIINNLLIHRTHSYRVYLDDYVASPNNPKPEVSNKLSRLIDI